MSEPIQPMRTLHYDVHLDPDLGDEAAFEYVAQIVRVLRAEFLEDAVWLRLFRGEGSSGLQNPAEFTGPERLTIAAAVGQVSVPSPGEESHADSSAELDR